jgi:hypothetical protein
MDTTAMFYVLDAAIKHAEAQDARDSTGRRRVQIQHRDTNAWPHAYGMARMAAAGLGLDMEADDLGPEDILVRLSRLSNEEV